MILNTNLLNMLLQPMNNLVEEPAVKSMPLIQFHQGDRVRIDTIEGGRDMTRRLLGLGIRVGSEVEVLHHRGRGLVVVSGANRIALGGGVAERLWAESLS